MLLQDEAVQTIINLGLTVLQAKVYIALAKLGTSTGRTTAKAAKVASQDVYRVLAELQEKGLVEKIISRPNKYRPIPLEKGLSMLLQRRHKQTAELEKAVFEIFKSFQSIDSFEDKNEIGDFVLIPEQEPIANRLTRAFESAQTSIDLMNAFREGVEGHEINFELEMNAINRGVKIRDMLGNPQKGFQIPSLFLKLLQREPDFQVITIRFPSAVKLLIKDKKEVLISTKTKAKTIAQPYLWSNNPILVQVIQHWYDMIWEKSSKEGGSRKFLEDDMATLINKY